MFRARDGILSPPFSSIEEYLGAKSNTDAYYEVLRTVGARYTRLWSELEAELGRRKLDERMIDALYEAALGFRVRSARYRAAAELSNQVATKDLRALVQQGLLVPKGEKKGRTYVAAPALIGIRDGTREPRVSVADVLRGQLTLPL